MTFGNIKSFIENNLLESYKNTKTLKLDMSQDSAQKQQRWNGMFKQDAIKDNSINSNE